MIIKKAQEEMVGFAVLVILVAVIGVIFLAISLKNPSQNQITSVNVQQFSESLISSTTNCSTGTWPSLSSFSEVIDKCYNSPSEQCSEGKSVCAYLNETIPSIISSVWNIAPESAYNGASFSSIFKDRISGEEKEFLSGSSGNCTSDLLGGESIFWVSQTQSVLGNPPHAAAFIVTTVFFFCFLNLLENTLLFVYTVASLSAQLSPRIAAYTFHFVLLSQIRALAFYHTPGINLYLTFCL